MSNSYTTYQYIIKMAAPGDSPSLRQRAFYAIDAPLNVSGIARGWYNGGADIAHGAGRIRDTVYGTFNPLEDRASQQNSVAHTIGKEIGNFFLPKVFDPDDLGPYEEYSDYLKDTEEGEMYLSQAAKLRQAARKVLRERKQKEMEKEHASSSRYF